MTTLGDNPRYANYARAHGRTADEQIKQDRIDWPGGVMTGFTLWSNARIGEAMKEIPEAFVASGLSDHVAYDAWLTAWVDRHVQPADLPYFMHDVMKAAAKALRSRNIEGLRNLVRHVKTLVQPGEEERAQVEMLEAMIEAVTLIEDLERKAQ